MSEIRLTGQLICQDDSEIDIVKDLLPEHVERTRAEAGCIFFTVEPTADSRVWEVSEHFRDAESFAHHQERVRTTEWDAEPPKSSEAIQ